MWRWSAAKGTRFPSSMYMAFKCHPGEDGAAFRSVTVWDSQNSPARVPLWPFGRKYNSSLLEAFCLGVAHPQVNAESRASQSFRELMPMINPRGDLRSRYLPAIPPGNAEIGYPLVPTGDPWCCPCLAFLSPVETPGIIHPINSLFLILVSSSLFLGKSNPEDALS